MLAWFGYMYFSGEMTFWRFFFDSLVSVLYFILHLQHSITIFPL